MKWGFRKSKKIMPGVTVRLNKRSIGVRVGTKHVGVSANTRGGARVSGSIPGTGVSVSQQLLPNGGSTASRREQPQREQELICEQPDFTPRTDSYFLSLIILPVSLIACAIFGICSIALVFSGGVIGISGAIVLGLLTLISLRFSIRSARRLIGDQQ